MPSRKVTWWDRGLDDTVDAATTLAAIAADRAHLRARVTPTLSRVYAVAYACTVALLPTALAFLGAGRGIADAATLLVYLVALATLVSTTRRRLGFWPRRTARDAAVIVVATAVYLGGAGAAFFATRAVGSWWVAGCGGAHRRRRRRHPEPAPRPPLGGVVTEPGAGGPPAPADVPRDAAAENEAFDELVHAPLRLRTCALLDQAEEVRFAVLQDVLGVSASVLSKHVAALGRAGYVTVGKHWADRRTRTTVRLTPAGRRAYRAHVAALRAIVGEG